MNDSTQFCPEDTIQSVVAILQRSDDAGLIEIDRLLGAYASDPRLHFLKGSILAGVQRYDEGRAAMRAAIEIAPDFHLARFQLGFLEFTSGMPDEAAATWSSFEGLEDGAAFRLLSEGLCSLARDEFVAADRLLRLGIAANSDHPLINDDMQLILDEIAQRRGPETHEDQAPDAASATHQMLQQFKLKGNASGTRH